MVGIKPNMDSVAQSGLLDDDELKDQKGEPGREM